MKLEQIFELQEKGFSNDQIKMIDNLAQGATLPAKSGEIKPAQNPAEPEAEAKTALVPAEPEAEAKTALVPTEPAVGDLVKEIEKLTSTIKEMQAENIRKAEHDEKKSESIEDLISSFMSAS